jgi:Terminase small subunit
MTNFPTPPGAIKEEPKLKDELIIKDTHPVDEYKKRNGALTDNEMSFILDTTLKPKHRRDESVLAFIDEFIRCKNIAEASENAGISPKLGYMIRHRMDVANAIQKLIDKSAIKYGFDASEIIERAKEIVDFDPISMQNADGTFKSKLYDIEPAARRNLKKLKVHNLYNQVEDINGIKKKIIVGEVIEYEFYDKLKAIDLVGKEKELFKTTTRVEHTVTKDMASILLAAANRGSAASLGYSSKPPIDAEVINGDSTDGE